MTVVFATLAAYKRLRVLSANQRLYGGVAELPSISLPLASSLAEGNLPNLCCHHRKLLCQDFYNRRMKLEAAFPVDFLLQHNFSSRYHLPKIMTLENCSKMAITRGSESVLCVAAFPNGSARYLLRQTALL
jgi:hypothetical protein